MTESLHMAIAVDVCSSMCVNRSVECCSAHPLTQISWCDKRDSISQTLLIRHLQRGTSSSMLLIIRAALGHLCRIHGPREERHLQQSKPNYYSTTLSDSFKQISFYAFYFHLKSATSDAFKYLRSILNYTVLKRLCCYWCFTGPNVLLRHILHLNVLIASEREGNISLCMSCDVWTLL